MRPLPLRPLPVPTEPLSDYLERLANANGYGAREFWGILDRGEKPHAQVLSDALNGYVLPSFSGPADPRVDISVDQFGLHTSEFTHMRRRWCPLCIDDAAWLRPIWRLKIATVCAIHRVKLLQECPACGTWGDVPTILCGKCECGVRFRQVVVTAERKHIQFITMLANSLNRTATLELEGVSVEMTTSQIVRMICYTGRLIEGPGLKRPGQVRDLEALSVASEIVDGATTLFADWPSVFWHCLERFVDAAPADASVRRVFGPLYHVLYQDLKDPVFHFMRTAFELFLLEHWRGELCGRHRLFSEETIEKHRHQGLARVARAAGMSSKRLRKMIHQDRFPANQFNPDGARHIVTVDKDLLLHLLPNPAEYLDLRATARVLGLKPARLRQLVAHGAILADAQPDYRRSNRWHFRRSEVEGFMDEIRKGALHNQLEENTITLTHALRFWRVTAAELGELARALKRQEIQFAAPPGCRFSGLTFSEEQLRNWFTDLRATTIEWISVSMASKRLGLKEQVVYELVSKNLIDADVISKNGHATRRLSLSSLDRFKQTFISASELAQLRSTSTTALLKCISAVPITGPKIDGGRQYFFRRGDIDISTVLLTD